MKIEGEKVLEDIETRKQWAEEYIGSFWDGYRFALKILTDTVKTEMYVSKSRAEWKGEDNA